WCGSSTICIDRILPLVSRWRQHLCPVVDTGQPVRKGLGRTGGRGITTTGQRTRRDEGCLIPICGAGGGKQRISPSLQGAVDARAPALPGEVLPAVRGRLPAETCAETPSAHLDWWSQCASPAPGSDVERWLDAHWFASAPPSRTRRNRGQNCAPPRIDSPSRAPKKCDHDFVHRTRRVYQDVENRPRTPPKSSRRNRCGPAAISGTGGAEL